MSYDDTAGDINIEEIKNKTISAEITDISDFPATDSNWKRKFKNIDEESYKK